MDCLRESDIHVAIAVIIAASNHAKWKFQFAQQMNALIIAMDFHQDDAIHQSLLSELTKLGRIIGFSRPDDEMVAVLAGRMSGAGNKFKFRDAQAAFNGRKNNREDSTTFAG